MGERLRPEESLRSEAFNQWISGFKTEGANLPNTIFYLPGGLWSSSVISCAFLQCLVDMDVRPELIVGSSAPAMVLGLAQLGYPPAQSLEIINSFKIETVKRAGIVPFPTFLDNFKLLRLYSKVAEDTRRIYLNNAITPSEIDRNSFKVALIGTEPKTCEPVLMSHGKLIEAVTATGAYPFMYEPFYWNGQKLIDGDLAQRLPLDKIQENFQLEDPFVHRINTPQSNLTTTFKSVYYGLLGKQIYSQEKWVGTDKFFDLNVNYNTSKFGTFSFGHPQMKELYEGAYKTVHNYLHSIHAQ